MRLRITTYVLALVAAVGLSLAAAQPALAQQGLGGGTLTDFQCNGVNARGCQGNQVWGVYNAYRLGCGQNRPGGMPVFGRLGQTLPMCGDPQYRVLNIQGWSLRANDAFVWGCGQSNRPVLFLDYNNPNTWMNNNVLSRPVYGNYTVSCRELSQFVQMGYEPVPQGNGNCILQPGAGMPGSQLQMCRGMPLIVRPNGTVGLPVLTGPQQLRPWCGMEWGAPPPSSYTGGARPPVTTPTQTWCGMEWGAPRPSTYRPPPTSRPPSFIYRPGFQAGCNGAANWTNSGLTYGPVALTGVGLTVEGGYRCFGNDDRSDDLLGCAEASGGTFLAVGGTGAFLYGGGATAAGGTLLTAAPPAAACVAVGTVSYCGTRAVDNACGGRISDSVAVGMCAVGDTCANVFYRWWGSDDGWNYQWTGTMCDMWGGSARSNVRGCTATSCGGSVQQPYTDPPYEGEEGKAGGCAVAQWEPSTALLLAVALFGVMFRRRRRNGELEAN